MTTLRGVYNGQPRPKPVHILRTTCCIYTHLVQKNNYLGCDTHLNNQEGGARQLRLHAAFVPSLPKIPLAAPPFSRMKNVQMPAPLAGCSVAFCLACSLPPAAWARVSMGLTTAPGVMSGVCLRRRSEHPAPKPASGLVNMALHAGF